MHILDLIMYFVTIVALWQFLALVSNRQLTEELGGVLGTLIIFVFTIVYIAMFGFYDWNWIDIFSGKYSLPFTITW